MSDFYLKVTSAGNRLEFPHNKADHFQNRLLFVKRVKKGWKVGLAKITLPRAPVGVKLKDPFLFRFKWYRLTDPNNKVYMPTILTIDQKMIDDYRHAITNGVQFMTVVKRVYDHGVELVFDADTQLGQLVSEGRDKDGNDIKNFRRLYTQFYPFKNS